ncbi:FapA family protein [Peribacillus alkalitolerans]|uniref:FapA family protein n=1 Tax=Peribacillus alkalitolerans TaxID=1550385 RepID=UPI0013D0DE45|nr:FapA family protein [Peribacillus alkalitolerans]
MNKVKVCIVDDNKELVSLLEEYISSQDDMNFIDEVKKGDFLGEKLSPTEGKPGKTVTGEIIVPKRGTDKKLFYDPNSVGEYQEGGRVVLRALLNGVVEYRAGRLHVGDHLVINGDVGVETGNIDFQGSITIKGIVKEGYSVKATKDISIMSELGVSGINRIESLDGDVFIKGGIFGKGTSVVKAAKNIFVKYTNEAVLEAGENINIGYYSVGSVLKAKNILTDDKNGKLIGGIIEATGRIRTGVIGNKLERKTILNVHGFDREKMQLELESIISVYKEKLQTVERLKRKLDIFESFLEQLNALQYSQYIEVKREFDKIMIEIFQFEERKKSLLELLETKGEGEISIGLIAFPETLFNIKNLNKRLNQATKGTFYAQGNSLHYE